MTNRDWATLLLICLVVLLAGCTASGAQSQHAGEATRAATEPATAALAPTSAASASTEELAETGAPVASVVVPEPTATTPTPAAEPAPTRTPLPTATPSLPPPTPTPSVTPAAAFSVDDLQRITPAQAKALLDRGALLYDVRPEDEYLAQHASGALSLPDASIASRYGELPVDKSLIFY